jgi:hypothetical protein
MSIAVKTRHQAPAFVHWKPVQSTLVPSKADSNSAPPNTLQPQRDKRAQPVSDIDTAIFQTIAMMPNALPQQGHIFESP